MTSTKEMVWPFYPTSKARWRSFSLKQVYFSPRIKLLFICHHVFIAGHYAACGFQLQLIRKTMQFLVQVCIFNKTIFFLYLVILLYYQNLYWLKLKPINISGISSIRNVCCRILGIFSHQTRSCAWSNGTSCHPISCSHKYIQQCKVSWH